MTFGSLSFGSVAFASGLDFEEIEVEEAADFEVPVEIDEPAPGERLILDNNVVLSKTLRQDEVVAPALLMLGIIAIAREMIF